MALLKNVTTSKSLEDDCPEVQVFQIQAIRGRILLKGNASRPVMTLREAS
jgi:hypothetical protein